jgi:hypothetical protein
MKRFFATLSALALAAALTATAAQAGGTKGSWTGWFTDESCGAKGANAEHKDCAEKCLSKGGKVVFYNTGDQKIYSIDKQDMAKSHLGHQVKVTGHVDGTAIHVESVEASPAK